MAVNDAFYYPGYFVSPIDYYDYEKNEHFIEKI